MLSVDISMIVVFVIAWILVIVLTRLFFKPLKKVMIEREQGIENDLQAGKSAAGEHEEIIRKIEEDVKQTRLTAQSTRQNLEKQAQEQRDRLLSEVSRECRDQMSRARKELDQQIVDLKNDLEAESERMAELIEKKLLN